ncbi:hypothetical protein WA026_002765 [Henosepilachna vigintioctopunctata]|uniref:Uncharacterized protein n=1 Tax=Henosepilachna vigintioctopunctata TaxID=420089 RepID=A0AAW1TVV0_9CUCU
MFSIELTRPQSKYERDFFLKLFSATQKNIPSTFPFKEDKDSLFIFIETSLTCVVQFKLAVMVLSKYTLTRNCVSLYGDPFYIMKIDKLGFVHIEIRIISQAPQFNSATLNFIVKLLTTLPIDQHFSIICLN